ncbi:hypothetical protein P4O66_010684, partial [Electrophorus voltai]
MSGVGVSQNTSPPVGRPCTTPTAPQVSHSVPQPEPLIGCRPLPRMIHSTVLPHSHSNPPALPSCSLYTDSPRKGPVRTIQPKPEHLSFSEERPLFKGNTHYCQLNSQVAEQGNVMYNVDSAQVLPAPVDLKPALPISPIQVLKAVNGLAERNPTPPCSDPGFQPSHTSQLQPAPSPPRPHAPISEPSPAGLALEAYCPAKAAIPAAGEAVATGMLTPSLPSSTAAPSGLTLPGQAVIEAGLACGASTGAELKETGKEPEVLLEDKVEPILQPNLRQSLSQDQTPPRKIISNVSMNNEVQLKKANNAWKPGMKRENTQNPETQKTQLSTSLRRTLFSDFRVTSCYVVCFPLQELFQKVRSILNKLTPQMFNQLMKQVMDLTIDTEERLKGVVDLVFEKAIDEPSFSMAYGNMCSCLAKLKVPIADKPTSTASERERLKQDLEEAKDKAHRRSIGNIKLIGELFKLRMLSEAIMHDCVVKLFMNHNEESLERLCHLLTAIGKDLDLEKARPQMDHYFSYIERTVKERRASSRIRFLLEDVIDLRLHNWGSWRADQGPKTIEQIHKEAKFEEQEEQRKVHQQLLFKDNKRR